MKKQVIICCVMTVCLFCFFSTSYAKQPLDLRTGTLRVVLVGVNAVVIDQQRYQLADNVGVSLQSSPEEKHALSPTFEGRKVLYVVGKNKNNDDVVMDLFILEK